MRYKMLQKVVTLMESLGPTQIGTYTMPADQVADMEGASLAIIGLEVLAAIGTGTNPTFYFEGCEDLGRADWSVLWSSDAQGSASVILTLSRSVEPGQPFRLAKFLRWRVVFPTPGAAAPSKITFRIGASAS